ncbi:MAG: acyl-CoA dehydrogenase family protein, partial [Deltaproteobacteria bacterium]|nr:acyl-CoA dehydrogenase family protein [Deltaproteobacteria bacterium]
NEEGEEWEKRLAWHKKMHADGWIAIQYPKQYGGRGATITQQYIYDEELNRAGAPQLVNGQGIGLVGPTLMHWGTEEQRQRYLPKMLAAEEIWCQGYSEPGSGSDLASLQTRAIEDGDYFVVNGQKVWTSDAHHADMCFLLVRTDPAAPKHKGISYLLVDMHSPGITVRPLVQMTGDRGFNEMFLEDVRVPKKNLVGEKNNGWLVALTSLMYERRARDMTPIVHELAALARLVPRNGINGWDDSRVRQRIAEFACEAWAIRYVGLRQLTRQLKGLPPGPESSIQKLAYSELNLRIQKFAMELLGAYGQMTYQAPLAIDEGKWSYRMLAARGMILGAGTSEIQRNIIGERVLGLPKG